MRTCATCACCCSAREAAPDGPLRVQCALESCERLVLVNRTFEKARALAQELSPYFRSDRLVGPAERLEAIPHGRARPPRTTRQDATSSSMPPPRHEAHRSAFDPRRIAHAKSHGLRHCLRKRKIAPDREAEAAGARAANGLSMLLHQGALSFEIWFGRAAPLEVMRAALKAAS